MSSQADHGYEHFPLPYVVDRRHPRKKAKRKGGGLPIRRSIAGPGSLEKSAMEVYDRAVARKTFYSDDRVYFKVTFTGQVGLGPINEAIEGLECEVVRVLPGDETVKLALRKGDIEKFKLRLHKFAKVIDSVVESSLSDVADRDLLPKLLHGPSRQLSVTVRLFDAEGLKDAEGLEKQLREYLSGRGEVEQVYLAGNWAVYVITAQSSDVLRIVESLGQVDHVQEMPPIELVPSSTSRRRTEVNLASIIDIQSARVSHGDLPTVCVVDSGIRRTHRLLKDYIVDTWDFGAGSQGPCNDLVGHGSMVAGIAIHGGNLQTHTRPVTRVIMVKAFEKNNPVRVRGTLNMVQAAISRFQSIAKVYNLSFAAKGPNVDLSEILNDLIFEKEVTVVAAAGNIDLDVIKDHLNRGEQYPDYMTGHFIYFPGDVDNALTVGSSASTASNFFHERSPSPFTRVGSTSKKVKPDVLAEGGNLNVVREGNTVIGLNWSEVGVTSASSNDDDDMPEKVGTSFASPAIASLAARIIDKYPSASPFLVKALILSAASSLEEATRSFNGSGKTTNVKRDEQPKLFEPFPPLMQGYGVVDNRAALSSSDWNANYLLQGRFTGTDPLEVHNYEFGVANEADSVRIMFVAGRPAWSDGYFTFRVTKSGPKDWTVSKFDEAQSIGDPSTARQIRTTYRRVYRKDHGGVGLWKLQVVPHFTRVKGVGHTLKYGCVISVRSASSSTIYKETSEWLESRRKMAEAWLEQRQAEKMIIPEAEQQVTLARAG